MNRVTSPNATPWIEMPEPDLRPLFLSPSVTRRGLASAGIVNRHGIVRWRKVVEEFSPRHQRRGLREKRQGQWLDPLGGGRQPHQGSIVGVSSHTVDLHLAVRNDGLDLALLLEVLDALPRQGAVDLESVDQGGDGHQAVGLDILVELLRGGLVEEDGVLGLVLDYMAGSGSARDSQEHRCGASIGGRSDG